MPLTSFADAFVTHRVMAAADKSATRKVGSLADPDECRKGASLPTALTERVEGVATAAHPDDIEFMMAGTLILLDEGWDVHCMNVSTGNLGS